MRNYIIALAAILIVSAGCSRTKNATTEEAATENVSTVNVATANATTKNVATMEDVSITFSGIEFSKSINNASRHSRVESNQLSVNGVTGTNYFNSPDGTRREATAPILLTKIDNTKPFTFTTRLQCDIPNRYDAGTLYLYVDNDNWLKFAFELDEKNRKRVVTVRTTDFSDDNNHDIIRQDHVYFKISSDSKQIGFYYSTDGKDWNLARLYRNPYPEVLWVGVSSQSPGGKENTAYFSDMSLTQDHVTNFRLGI